MWISAQEISQHCTRDDCWVVINDHVWDLTTFAPEHPGGFSCKSHIKDRKAGRKPAAPPNLRICHTDERFCTAIYCFAGHDATEAYNEVHSTDVITKALDPNKLIGKIDRSSIDSNWTSRYIQQAEKQAEAKPPLGTILNAHDFERVAQDTLSKKAWAFYSSAATDLVSVNANRLFYNRIWFRPRLLRDVKSVSTKCIIQGVESALPVVVAPVALARLANPIGEKGIAMAAAGKGIIHCVRAQLFRFMICFCTDLGDGTALIGTYHGVILRRRNCIRYSLTHDDLLLPVICQQRSCTIRVTSAPSVGTRNPHFVCDSRRARPW